VEVSKEIDFAKRQEALLRLTGGSWTHIYIRIRFYYIDLLFTRLLTVSSESTNSRIQWFSILSILILLTASLWQILYLRHFFASKKLL